MTTLDRWATIQKINEVWGGQYAPVMAQAAKEAELPEQWGILWLILEWEPEAISPTKLQRRDPYTTVQRRQERLAQLVGEGLLQAEGNEYRLTDSARTRVKRVIRALNTYLATLEPLPTADMNRLAALMLRAVEASSTAPEPPGKEALRHNRNSDEGPNAAAAVRVLQYLTDLAAYRDECHLAAWRTYQVSGSAWEALTFIWRGEAYTAAALAEKLPFRGHSAADYGDSLGELAAQGWIAERADQPGAYEVTEQGKTLRQEAEDKTDRYFFAPWAALSAGEQTELEKQLSALLGRLEAAQPAAAG